MYRLPRFLIVLMIILLLSPILCFALEPISDTELEAVSAQAGVDLTFMGSRDTAINLHTEGFSWGDNNGFSGSLADGASMIFEGSTDYFVRIPHDHKISIDVDHRGVVITGLADVEIDLPATIVLGVPFPWPNKGSMRIMVYPDSEHYTSSDDMGAAASQYTLGIISFNNQTTKWTLCNQIIIGPH